MKKIILFLIILFSIQNAFCQPTLKHPGVYVEEVSPLPTSVAQVETAIPAFIGYTRQGVVNIPTDINNMEEFVYLFGKGFPAGFDVEISESRGAHYVKKVTRTSPDHFYLYYAMKTYFENGGGRCYIVSTGTFDDRKKHTDESVFIKALDEIKKLAEPTLLVFPDALFLPREKYFKVVDHALAQCAGLNDRFTIIDLYTSDITNANSVESELKTGQQFRNATLDPANLKYGAAYTPYLNSAYSYDYWDKDVRIIKAGSEKSMNFGDKAFKSNHLKLLPKITDALIAEKVVLPPSAAIAGVYVRVDRSQGVWKAPANVSLARVVSPSVTITSSEQEGLNVDPVAGKSINAIRSFPGNGILVWGARTLAGNDNEWRYVNVRRFFMMVEESITKSTRYVVFEPNNADTWTGVKTIIKNYLNSLWMEGALAGSKPEDAFFVKVGLGETMTAQDILENRMNIEIGLALMRPAEFMIFTIEQTTGSN